MDEDACFDPIAYLNEPRWRKVSLGLSRIRLLLSKLGNPQERFKSVHVAGTNGKGSVCAYLSSILSCAGYKTGLFTSPYIFEFEERIRIDGSNIPPELLRDTTIVVRDAAREVAEVLGEHPTEFELMFAVACCAFASQNCDICVIECGLGGRLDATNAIDPILCAITPIALDHTDILGDTLAEIASEKAGIIKRGVTVVSYPQDAMAMQVIERKCEETGSLLIVPDMASIIRKDVDIAGVNRRFIFDGREYATSLIADYQPENAAIAICCAEALRDICGIPIGLSAVSQGIKDASWPGRFEIISVDPLVIVDGSHNPHGAESLVRSLEAIGATPHSVSFAVGMLADKDYRKVLEQISDIASSIAAFTPSNPRALDGSVLAEEARAVGIRSRAVDSSEKALETALQNKEPDGIVCAIGSLYSIDALKKAFSKLEA